MNKYPSNRNKSRHLSFCLHPKAALCGHFKRRCDERFGVLLRQKTAQSLVNSGKARLLGKNPNTFRYLYKLSKEICLEMGVQCENDVIIIYDSLDDAFVTAFEDDGRPRKLLTKQNG